jgi:DNA-binding IclR family transcriptional regulator
VVANEEQEKPYSSAVAVERAVDLLFLIAQNGEVALTDLARGIGSSGSAVHRILTALKKKGLIEQTTENGPYSLSWSILGLTQRLMAESDLRTISLPLMHKLRDATSETVTINVRSGFHRVCIDQVESNHEVRWRQEVGRISPLYAGPTGKVILTYFSTEELDEYLSTVTFEKLTPYTTVDPDEIRRELDEIRAHGYAIGTQDRILGIAGTSAPIFDEAGAVAGILAIAGPSERCTDARLESWGEPLVETTRQISELLKLRSPVATPFAERTSRDAQPSRQLVGVVGDDKLGSSGR